jgi:transcriptional regulator with XRE-family HTH domain
MLCAMDGETLRRRRQSLGLSQEKMSRVLAVPQATISRWESGKHRIEHAAILDLALWALETQERIRALNGKPRATEE